MIPQPPSTFGLPQVFSGFWASAILPQFGEQAVWFQRVNSDMPGATPTPGWDAVRGVSTTYQDGSYGVGWQINGSLGYLPPQLIQCAKNDNFRQEEITDAGLTIYQGPVVLYMPPAVLRKGDVLVFSDGRYAVGDEITPAQVMGQTVITGAKLEQRSSDDIVQTLPLS